MTGENAVYLYTGIEGQYGLGPLRNFTKFYSWVL